MQNPPSFGAPVVQRAGVASLLCLLLLLCGDAAFLIAHLASRGDAVMANLYDLGKEGGYAEMFQYFKAGAIALVLGVIWSRTHEPVYGAWMLLFAFVLCDDAFQVHETLGTTIANFFGYEARLGLRAKDFGELSVWAIFGLIFLAAIAASYWKASREARKACLGIAQLFLVLAFFGAAMDMAHSAVSGRLLKAAFTIIEDGGEMAAMTLIAWYIVRLLESRGTADPLIRLGRFTPR